MSKSIPKPPERAVLVFQCDILLYMVGQVAPLVRWMRILISTLLFVLPFAYLPGYGSYSALRYFTFGSFALALGVLLICIWFIRPGLAGGLSRSIISAGLLVYILAFLIVSILGINPALSFFSTLVGAGGFFALILLSIFMYSVATVVLIEGQSVAYRFIKVSVFSASLFSLFIWLSVDGVGFLTGGIFEQSKGGAMIGNSSLAAFYLTWNAFFALALFLRARLSKERLSYGLAIFLIICSPLFVNWHAFLSGGFTSVFSLIGIARGGALGLCAGMILIAGIVASYSARKRVVALGKTFTFSFLFLVVLCIGLLMHGGSMVHSSFGELATNTRFIFWDSALKGFIERPWTGWGPSTFSEVYHRHFDPIILSAGNTGEVLVHQPHNMFFSALSDGGVLLLVGLLIFLISIIQLAIKFMRIERLLGAVFIGGLFAWIIQLQFVFESIASAALLFLVIGMMLGWRGGVLGKDAAHVSMARRIVAAACFILIALGFLYIIIFPMRKAHRMQAVYDMYLPARAAAWSSLSGISPMGDAYDSALMFSKISEAYWANMESLRAGDPAARHIAVYELDQIGNYLDGLIAKNRQYELVFVAGKLRYVRLLIQPDASGSIAARTRELFSMAIEMSPTDPRPVEFLRFIDGR